MNMSKVKQDNRSGLDDLEESSTSETKKRCFVIMPISDHPDYELGHFDRVYEELIKPAVEIAGFIPMRADGIKQTHIIILEILKSIVDFEMAICDVSSLNPNVMYELGIRQMAQKPVVLIKDLQTKRIFDTGILNDIEYDSSLRVDKVRKSIAEISNSLINTHGNSDKKANSLIELLSIDIQLEKRTVEITQGEKLIMNAIERLFKSPQNSEVKRLEPIPRSNRGNKFNILGMTVRVGEIVEMTLKDSSQKIFLVLISGNSYEAAFINLDTMELRDYKTSGTPSNFTDAKIVNAIAGELDEIFNSQQIFNIERVEKETGLSIITPF
jgi:hypothetical protein